jgi:hypothetical protein
MSMDQIKILSKNIFPNTEILLDDLNMPSVMYKIPKFYVDDVLTGGPHTIFPCFDVWKGGAWVTLNEIYISKYQNCILNSRAYSLPLKQPTNNITIDAALAYCETKGLGWHLMSYIEWAGILLWCKKNLIIPRGNNNAGFDITYPDEYGTITSGSYTATGSGPSTWNHNFTRDGISDLNGNVAEWLSGIRLNAGEINVMERNKAVDAGVVGHSVGSGLWKSLNKTGGVIQNAGAADAMFMDALTATPTGIGINDSIVNTTTDVNSTTQPFQTITNIGTADAAALLILKTFGLYPDGLYDSDLTRIRNNGERFCTRGGDYSDTVNAGLGALDFLNKRTDVSTKIGFRCSWADMS